MPEIPPSPPAAPDAANDFPAAPKPRTFFQRLIIDPIVIQLTQGITPEKIALTLAAGGAVALFPMFGVTSILCFFVGLALRLNQPIIQILNQLLWPVHIATVLLCIRLGEFLFRVPAAERLLLSPRKIYAQYFAHFWSHPFQSLAGYIKDNADSVLYSIIAWALLVPVFVPIVYYSTLPVLRGILRVKTELVAKQLAGKPPEHPVP